MSEAVAASDGTLLPLDSLTQTFTYSGGFVVTASVVYSGNSGANHTYTQTFTNDGTNITSVSGWIAA